MAFPWWNWLSLSICAVWEEMIGGQERTCWHESWSGLDSEKNHMVRADGHWVHEHLDCTRLVTTLLNLGFPDHEVAMGMHAVLSIQGTTVIVETVNRPRYLHWWHRGTRSLNMWAWQGHSEASFKCPFRIAPMTFRHWTGETMRL